MGIRCDVCPRRICGPWTRSVEEGEQLPPGRVKEGFLKEVSSRAGREATSRWSEGEKVKDSRGEQGRVPRLCG